MTQDIEGNSETRMHRRALLQTVAGATVGGSLVNLTTQSAAATHPTSPCGDAVITFGQCKVARVREIQQSDITGISVLYFDREGNKQKQTGIEPTTNATYGPFTVRYARGHDMLVISATEPKVRIRRVIAHGDNCRTAQTNPAKRCAGDNEAPSADFTWTPETPTVGEQVTFTSTATDPDGELIHYGWDVTDDGTEEVNGEQVTYTFTDSGEQDVHHQVIDDFNATDDTTQTLTVTDPANFDDATKLLAPDRDSDDAFGASVAVDGETALIGAWVDDENGADSGSAYVFTGADTSWGSQAKLVPQDGDNGDHFGLSVSIDGDTALVGAPFDDTNGRRSGSVYVFTQSGTTWSQQAKLTPVDGTSGDYFGREVVLDGDTALIGAWHDDANGTDSGAAYVFTRPEADWSQQTKLTATDGAAGDYFGRSVALDGDTALIGAFGDAENGYDAGAAYIFTRSGTAWNQQTKLTAPNGDADDQFGFSTALDGETAVVGTWRYTDEPGSAYVFTHSDTTWQHQTELTVPDATDYFGFSVAIDGDVVLVGDEYDDENGTHSGSVYAFTRSGTTWRQQTELTAPDGDETDRFGSHQSVALDGGTALIGAYGDEADVGWYTGSAYVFT